jgi:ribonucleoside-diphosphate reductase beta chain
MITGYGHFVQLADSLQWDEKAIDFTADVEAWSKLEDAESARVFGLIAGFCIAENAVAQHLTHFQDAATVDDSMAACFRSQARDEARHARFFDRVAAEVVGIPGASLRERLDTFRERVSDDLVDLFEDRLPATAQRLADDHGSLTAAVGLYHMVLEGIVLSAGQSALLEDLDDGALPGVRKGVYHVELDERWHIGFGLRLLIDARPSRDLIDGILARADEAAAAWGDALPEEIRDMIVPMARRRMGVATKQLAALAAA